MKKMVKKKESKKVLKRDISEGLGISGFTLGVMSIILVGGLGLIISIVGFAFCYIQQKHRPTKLGKNGLILNIIGFVLSLILIVVSLVYFYPLMQQQMQVQPF